jgi:hypothetical protein
MTLILTEVSTYGVAMAADSAVTFPDGRIYIGAQKLLPIPQIDAGISIWGRGDINGTDADVWLQNFIGSDVQNGMAIWDMAEALANRLNSEFGGPITDRMGIHVGGFDERNGIRGPAFYHIHNGHFHYEFGNGRIWEVPEEDPPIRELRVHDDRPPAIYAGDSFPAPTRNGDFSIFGTLYDQVHPILNSIQSNTGLSFPHPPSLAARGEYLRFWINIAREIYRLSNARIRILPQPATAGDASIGGPVTILTVSDAGIESFYTR